MYLLLHAICSKESIFCFHLQVRKDKIYRDIYGILRIMDGNSVFFFLNWLHTQINWNSYKEKIPVPRMHLRSIQSESAWMGTRHSFVFFLMFPDDSTIKPRLRTKLTKFAEISPCQSEQQYLHCPLSFHEISFQPFGIFVVK